MILPSWLLRTPFCALIGSITLFGLAIRLYRLGDASLWIDEAYSVWFSSQDWGYLWSEVPRFETHPSFYYSMLKLWRGMFGDSEFSLRFLSALANTATIPLVAMIARVCIQGQQGKAAAALAALLFACSATQLGASQDTRSYVFLTLALAICLLGAVRIYADVERALRPMGTLLRRDPIMALNFLAISFGIALLAWSHNLGGIYGLLLGACLVIFWLGAGRRSPSLFVNLGLSAVLAALLYAPNIPIVLMQTQNMGSHGFWVPRPGYEAVRRAMIQMPLGFSPFEHPQYLAGMFSIALGAAGLWVLWRSAVRKIIPVTLMIVAIGPAAVVLLISLTSQPIFLFRTLQASQVPVIVMISFAPLLVSRLRPAIGMVIVLLAGFAFWSFQGGKRADNEDWRQMAFAVSGTRGSEPPMVVLVPNALEVAFGYYKDRLGIDMTLVPIPASYPARGLNYVYPSGNGGEPLVTRDMVSALSRQVEGQQQLWFFDRGPELFDPEGLVETMLRERFPCVLRKQGEGILMARQALNDSCP